MGAEASGTKTSELRSSARLSVRVLATGTEGTRAALLTAERLTNGLDARVVLLVPRPHSVMAPFLPTSDERTRLLETHRELAATVGVHVTTLFCVCHRLDDVAHQMLGPSALVIVGGKRNVRWPSREQRLAARLTGRGHPDVFAQVGAVPQRARVPASGA